MSFEIKGKDGERQYKTNFFRSVTTARVTSHVIITRDFLAFVNCSMLNSLQVSPPTPPTMAATSKARPSIQRINNAYVKVPLSPMSLASYHPLKTHASSTKLKENTPLRPPQFTTNSSTSRKRKLSDCDSIHDGPISLLKRAKLVVADGTLSRAKAPQSQPIVPTANACTEFPNGYVYCHQCYKKRDILSKFAFFTLITSEVNILIATIQCNIIKQRQTKRKGTVELRCLNKYCKGCLKRKYNEDLEGYANGVASFFT